MNKNRTVSSKLIKRTLEDMDPVNVRQTQNRMDMAVRIDEAMKSKHIGKAQLAERLQKRPSEITKWLSGTHNFTIDTISMLEIVLNTTLLTQNTHDRKITRHHKQGQTGTRGL